MKYLIIPLLVLLTVDCIAQNTEADSPNYPILNWMSDNGIEIRRAFDGTKNEGKSALFQFLKDFDTDSNSTGTIDIAVKVKEKEFEDLRLYLYPVVEWHRKMVNEDLQDEDSYNKLSASLKSEWAILNSGFSPLLVGSASIKNDFKDEEQEGEFKIETTFFSTIEGLPGSNINGRNGNTILKYYPYFGYEHYIGLVEGVNTIDFLKSRLYVEFYPFGTDHMKGIFEYTKRWETGSNNLSIDPEIISGSFNVDLNKYFSITLEYENGELPVNDFGESHSLKIGLGFKI